MNKLKNVNTNKYILATFVVVGIEMGERKTPEISRVNLKVQGERFVDYH